MQQLVYEDTFRKVKNWIMSAALTKPSHGDGITLVSDLDGPPSDEMPKTDWDRAVQDYASSLPVSSKPNWKCHICKQSDGLPHRTLLSLCGAWACDSFNLAGSALSLPSNLDLAGKAAVVTGGRTSLGYRTALRLLRCGARVIVTTLAMPRAGLGSSPIGRLAKVAS